ncbi:MAG TPA: 2OG-Fe(II) oxygenase [Flavobacterium sp.]|jgi:Rps23 Pro-64 3,4-dihydroxylase Tpa1-like proline 4-hydroxylase
MELKRKVLTDYIVDTIRNNKEQLLSQYSGSRDSIGYFFLDDVLPNEIAMQIYDAFPAPESMVLKNSIREKKYIAVQMNLYNPILEEIIYAFQDSRVVKLVSEICGIPNPIPDESLYAGGISMMGNGHYLNPHLDNSHDKDRTYWRVLNLLYYVAPDWKLENGGNLELWQNGLENDQVTIVSKFNRLVVMATHKNSLHSVSPITVDAYRCCVSNYYFSENPLLENESFHVTSFRGRPENKLSDAILRIDAWLRMNIRKVFAKGIKENPHVYKKKD